MPPVIYKQHADGVQLQVTLADAAIKGSSTVILRGGKLVILPLTPKVLDAIWKRGRALISQRAEADLAHIFAYIAARNGKCAG